MSGGPTVKPPRRGPVSEERVLPPPPPAEGPITREEYEDHEIRLRAVEDALSRARTDRAEERADILGAVIAVVAPLQEKVSRSLELAEKAAVWRSTVTDVKVDVEAEVQRRVALQLDQAKQLAGLHLTTADATAKLATAQRDGAQAALTHAQAETHQEAAGEVVFDGQARRRNLYLTGLAVLLGALGTLATATGISRGCNAPPAAVTAPK